jgi:hypothetical protein
MRASRFKKIPRFRPLAAYRRLLVLACILLFASGCATLPRNAVPVDKINRAEIVGMPDIRAWGGQITQHSQADAVQSVLDESRGEFPRDENGVPIYDSLALSGGGSNGAFGAGFLSRWTKAGTRPNFKLVTGISTGALIAAFAFLGSDFDAQLKNLYTKVSTADLLIKQGILKILFRSEAAALTNPLARLKGLYLTSPNSMVGMTSVPFLNISLLLKAIIGTLNEWQRLVISHGNGSCQSWRHCSLRPSQGILI